MKSLTLYYSDGTVRDLNDIREFLEAAILNLGGDDDVAGDLILAVNEAVTNIFLHGYNERPGPVSVSVEADAPDMLVRLVDDAPIFDPTAVPPPDINLPLEERPLGGLGVHMMRQLTDELVHRTNEDGKNDLIFVKRGVLGRPLVQETKHE